MNSKLSQLEVTPVFADRESLFNTQGRHSQMVTFRVGEAQLHEL